MRALAIIFGVAVLAGMITMAAAGITWAIEILVTGAALVGMIVIGTRLGGRRHG